jgi:poly-gamma-glutamate capsule biosynthesis protein CapA/YwtB (metallophosphatase superfamily)
VTTSTRIGLLTAVAGLAVAAALWRNAPAPVDPQPDAPFGAPSDGAFTIALTGDTILTAALPTAGRDPGFDRVVGLLGGASLAVTNLETVLLDRAPAGGRPSDAWPFANRSVARELQRLGIDVVTRANNHAADYGHEGLAQTSAALDAALIQHVGVGADLDKARAGIPIGPAVQRLALMSVTVSSSPDARATPSRGEIAGRPGVNALRFAADITVDADTFATLSASLPALQPEATAGPGELTLFGRSIRKGEKTLVRFVLDAADERDLLAQVEATRRAAANLIVAIHSHEPSNHSDQPADFVRRFAQQLIERGATMVIGHGPHQLRGIEVHQGGVILHGLGNFVFPYEPLASRTADVFDAGVDLYALALGAVEQRDRRTPAPLDSEPWWESVIAVARFAEGALTEVRLVPLDLGVAIAPERRGTPRIAAPDRAAAILERLARLSAPYGATFRIEGGIGVLSLPAAGR